MFATIRDPATLTLAGPSTVCIVEIRRQEVLLKTGPLKNEFFKSANFSRIAIDARGVTQRPLIECGES